METFEAARQTAVAWLADNGHVPRPELGWEWVEIDRPAQPVPGLSTSGWHLDEAGFFCAKRGAHDRPHWYVRYWHDDDADATGVLRVYADGRVERGYVFFIGCLGLSTSGLVRIEADGTTSPVHSDYDNDMDVEYRGYDRERVRRWIRQGWTAEYGN